MKNLPSKVSDSTPEQLQKRYYADTAATYDLGHVGKHSEPEHDIAVAMLQALSRYHNFNSFLDVGAGTGRAMVALADTFPEAQVQGVEPVEELRKVAYGKGLSESDLIEGSAASLPFADKSFDVVSMFGVLHHVKDPRICISEMFRVSRKAIFLSDLNSFGCGGVLRRSASQLLDALGLWRLAQFITTRGKMYKITEGDGLAYSYSIFQDLGYIRSQSSEVNLMNTRGVGGTPYRNCSHVALLAIKAIPNPSQSTPKR